MQIVAAYIFVVLIWATTPIAIQLSNSSLSFLAAVSLRMTLALCLCLSIIVFSRKPLIEDREDLKAFAAGVIGLYPNMLIVYWSSQFISSGLMSIILGVYPFAVGLFSLFFLRGNLFNLSRLVGLCVAIAGLVIIHADQLRAGGQAIYGCAGMLLSSFLFALSTVWLKSIRKKLDPIRQSTGVLLVAVPAFGLTWFYMDGVVPSYIDTKSLLGISYLAIVGSVIGHTLFFFVLRNCQVGTVSLIPLLSPMLAISIGVGLAGEELSMNLFLGSSTILFAIAIYQGLALAGLKGLAKIFNSPVALSKERG